MSAWLDRILGGSRNLVRSFDLGLDGPRTSNGLGLMLGDPSDGLGLMNYAAV
jgi:hypothetical protein